jgi:hypothetical protein
MKYFFSPEGDYLGGFDAGSLVLVPDGAIEVEEPPAHGLDRLVDGVIIPYTPPIVPQIQIAGMILALPIEKKNADVWSRLITKCLRAIEYGDMESLAYLVNGFVTEDEDYSQIIATAKSLFNV